MWTALKLVTKNSHLFVLRSINVLLTAIFLSLWEKVKACISKPLNNVLLIKFQTVFFSQIQ